MTPYTAWRLVRPLQRFDYGSVLPSTLAGKYHCVGDRVLYGWSSSEMAFLSLVELAGSSQPSELIRERLTLPQIPGKVMTLAECIAARLVQPDELSPSRNISRLLRHIGLLGLWVDSDLMPSESVLILNPDEPSFVEISVTSTRLATARAVPGAQR